GHLRGFMHVSADTVTDVFANDGESLRLDVGLHGVADVPNVGARPSRGDTQLKRLAGDVNHALMLGCTGSADHRPAGVGPPAVENQPAIQRYDVAIFDHPRPR